jgi:GH35 family endo-1,4-beta-xylanase
LPAFLGSPSYERQTEAITAAKKRIASLRKAPVTITVINSAGKPVPNATVKLTQKAHEFRFGTAVVPSLILDKGPNGQRYREVLKKCFNTATFENQLKWRMESPSIFPNEVFPASDWLSKNGIALRGHTLVWGSRQNLPDGMMDLPVEQARQKVREHVRDYATKMKGRVYLWDVVNEAVTEDELWQKLGWGEFANTYRVARQVDPKAKLCYNDFNISSDAGNGRHRARAIEIAVNLKKSGAPVDIFGDQAHMGFPGTPPTRLNQIWDEVASKTGLRIEITEFDFTCRDDNLHAQYVEDFLTTAFAHPKIEGIILWGFWENAHWLANRKGHFVNADWSWRPGMKVLDRLINKEWKTNVTLRTNAKGQVVVPAFYGDYVVEVSTGVAKTKIKAKHSTGAKLVAKVRS